MTSISFGKPVGKPLYRLGGATVPGGPRVRTLNDPATFEITQDAAQHVASTDPRASKNPAIDIGNGYEGEPILAMAQGWATRVQDAAGARGSRVDHGANVTSEGWHFNDWAIPPEGAFVLRGQVIGYLGHTGLGTGAHCHIEIKVNGKALDPEPLIWGAPLVVKEDGLSVTTSGFAHVINRSTKLTVASNFRADATRQSDPLNVYAAGTAFVPTMQVSGEAIGPNSVWFGGWMYLPNKGYAFGFFHSSVLAPLVPVEQPDCTDEIAAATADAVKRVDLIKGDAAQIVPILERMRSR